MPLLVGSVPSLMSSPESSELSLVCPTRMLQMKKCIQCEAETARNRASWDGRGEALWLLLGSELALPLAGKVPALTTKLAQSVL